jgi:hypothetical protein
VSDDQQRLFAPERHSPVSVAVYQRLPEGNAHAFAIASALGRFLDGSGRSDRLRSGGQAACSLVDKRRLRAVLAALGDPDPSQWRRYVRDWVARYVAHRCAPGTVCLFTRPLLDECPACHAEMAFTHVPPSPRVRRGAGFADRNGSVTPAATGALLPSHGAGTPATPVQELPRVRTDAPHLQTGLLRGEVGMSGSDSQELPLPGHSQDAARRCSRCDHEHFVEGACRRPTCACEVVA